MIERRTCGLGIWIRGLGEKVSLTTRPNYLPIRLRVKRHSSKNYGGPTLYVIRDKKTSQGASSIESCAQGITSHVFSVLNYS